MDLFESLMKENKRISKSEKRIKQLQESSWMIRANKSGYSFKDLARKYEADTGISIYDEDANTREFLKWVEDLLGDENLVPTYEGNKSKKKVKESNNKLDISEYDYVSTMQNGSENYELYRKIGPDGKGCWAAWKQKMGDRVGDPFEITYRQAQGFDLIDDSGINKLSRDLGKLLLPREGRK